MKRLLLLTILCWLVQVVRSQTPFCGSDLAPTDPTAQALRQKLEQQAYAFFSTHPTAAPDGPAAVLIIPVVVHVIHDGGPENISDSQIQQGIAWLNAAFANAGYFDQGSGTDVGIQFCLAQRTPDGQTTGGITRNQHPLTSLTLETQDLALKNLNRWQPKQYLNIWLVREICSTSAGCGVVGYAYRPEYHGTLYDGLVIEAQFFGAVQSQMSVAAHELGHYLGLYHTFEGGCTNNNCLTDGDRICDTPPDQSTVAVACGQSVNTCSTDAQSGFATDQPDMTGNFLDYGNINCFHDFTPGQAARMNFYLNGARHSLLESKGCLPPCTTPVVSAFTPDVTTLTAGQTVTFTNISQNASSYQWSVDGTTFSAATDPAYTFLLPGTYTVTLLANPANDQLCDAASSQAIIQVVCSVEASFTVSNDHPTENEAIMLTNTSQYASVFSWTINGVAQGSTLDSATFSEAGVYTIQLTAGDGVCEHSVQHQVFVRDSCVAQTFQMQYGQEMPAINAGAYATAALADGSMVVLGDNYADSTGIHYGFYLLKMSPDGTLLWVRSLDPSLYAGASSSIAPAPDGGFVINLSGDLNADCYVAKWTAAGDIEWVRGVHELPDANIIDLQVNDSQETVALGYYGVSVSNEGPFFLKFGPAGEQLASVGFLSPVVGEKWERITPLPDGGMIGVGSNNGGYAQVVRIGADGNTVWRKRMILNGEGQFHDAVAGADSSIYLCGQGPYGNMWLLKIDLDGQPLWSKTYTRPGFYTDLHRMIGTDDGLTVVGRAVQDPYTTTPVWKAFIAHFDTTGTLLWNHTYLPGSGAVLNDVTPVAGGGYFAVGNIELNPAGQKAAWMLRMDRFGFAGACPAETVDLETNAAPVSYGPQTYPAFGPLVTTENLFPAIDVSVTPALLCEKACPTNVEICNNNLDDDGDGLFDCLDPDCPCAADVCQPRRNDRWYFGVHAGLDFSTEPPTSLSDGQTNTGQIDATICDRQGRLLFYTDGKRIFNRFHQVMPQGDNPHVLYEPLVTSIIVPHPGNPALYYVFISDQTAFFTYSLVDMRLDQGRGDVVGTAHFNDLLSGPVSMQGLAAVRACGFDGYWLATYHRFNNEMLAFRIDQNGLQQTPVISPAGLSGLPNTTKIKFSPQGKQLARVIAGSMLLLYDFDLYLTESGKFGNPQTIQPNPGGDNFNSVEYSPTGQYVYVTSLKTAPLQKVLYQFDVQAGNPAAVAGSRVEISTEGASNDNFQDLQLAPNGKIYVAHGLPSFQSVDIIHRPDTPGPACQFQKSALLLPLGANGFFEGFNNCIASDFRKPWIAFPANAPDSVCTQNSTVAYQIKNVPCGVDSISWKLNGLAGEINSNYQYASVWYKEPGAGQLIVTAHTGCGTAADTLPVQVYAPSNQVLDLGPDQTVCDHGVFTFHAGGGFARYRWQNGSADSILTTVLPGKYWVDVYDQCGNRQTDTVTVQIAPASVLAIGPDRLQCAGAPVTFQRPPVFETWQWSPDTFLSCDTCAGIIVDPATTTTWTVLAQTAAGCLSADTLHWGIVDTLYRSRDTTVCVGQALDLYGAQVPADTTITFLRPSSGPGCDTLLTVQVLGLEPPALTVQVQICPDQFFDYQGHVLPADTTATIYLPGSGCDTVVTVEVTSFPPALISLPADSTLLIGEQITLPAAVSGAGPFTFEWQPGTDLTCTDCLQPEAGPLDTVTYTLVVVDGHGCPVRDSITIRVRPDCRVLIPNAFTPNGDGVNDWFYPHADPCVRTVRLWRVVNRWGQVVFERRGFAPGQEDQGWDGRWQGKAVTSDVLVWMAELEYYDGRIERRRGEVALLR